MSILTPEEIERYLLTPSKPENRNLISWARVICKAQHAADMKDRLDRPEQRDAVIEIIASALSDNDVRPRADEVFALFSTEEEMYNRAKRDIIAHLDEANDTKDLDRKLQELKDDTPIRTEAEIRADERERADNIILCMVGRMKKERRYDEWGDRTVLKDEELDAIVSDARQSLKDTQEVKE